MTDHAQRAFEEWLTEHSLVELPERHFLAGYRAGMKRCAEIVRAWPLEQFRSVEETDMAKVMAEWGAEAIEREAGEK